VNFTNIQPNPEFSKSSQSLPEDTPVSSPRTPYLVPHDNPIYHLLIQILEFLIKKTWSAAATSLIAVALKV
jgi:hypothetical protein